jgi:hypothetical protein
VNPLAQKYGAPSLPQVNLVPKDINDKRTMRVVQTFAGLGVLAMVVLVAIVYVAALAATSVAQGNLDDAFAKEDAALIERDEMISVYYSYQLRETQELSLYQVGWADTDYAALVTSILAQDSDQTSFESLEIFGPSAVGVGGPGQDPLFSGGVGSFSFTAHARSYDEATALIARLEAVPGVAKVHASTQALESVPPGALWKVSGTGIMSSIVLTHRLDPQEGILGELVIDTLIGATPTDGPPDAATSPSPAPSDAPEATEESEG